MAKKIGWHFQESNNGSWKGFNDGDIAHFKGDRYGSLAREVIQNSLDAVADQKKPVVVSFELLYLDTALIPNREELVDKFKKCVPNAKKEKEEAGEFFVHGLELLKGKKIPILKISESNTKGMPGPCQLGNPFFAYLKATGTSKKESDTATGSHGIGKKAPLTSSNLRTIFVSTKWKHKDSEQVLFQGIATLMSHMEGKKTIDGVGYWGTLDGCGPVGADNQIPADFKRDSVGTNFFVVGFREKKNWEKQLLAAVAKNFFAAISRGRLVVKVNKAELTKNSIENLFGDKTVIESISELKKEPDSFLLSRDFFYCENSTSAETKFFETSEVLSLGLCHMQILVAEGLPQRVCVLRNNMLITTELDRLTRFPNMKEFVAIIECKSDAGNELLRGMEPARHDTFDPDQFESEEAVRKGTQALRKLAEWARKMLKLHAQIETSGGGAIDFLSEIFEEELETGSQSSLERNPDGKLMFQPKPIKMQPPPKIAEGEGDGEDGGGGGDGEGDGGGGDGDGDGTGDGDGAGGSGEVVRKSVHLEDVRAIAKKDGPTRIFFTSPKTGEVEIRLYAMGADAEDFLAVEWAGDASVKQGVVRKNVVAGARTLLEVKTVRHSVGGIKVTANEI